MSDETPVRHRALPYALLSLQIFRDKAGTRVLSVTSNPKTKEDEANVLGDDYIIFGRGLADQRILTMEELLRFRDMFNAAIDARLKLDFENENSQKEKEK